MRRFWSVFLVLLFVAAITFADDSSQNFSGSVDDTADSIPSSGTFPNRSYQIIVWNDDNADTIYVKLTGTGATTSDIPIKAGDPPTYFDFTTNRMSVICAAGQSCSYRIVVLERPH